MSYRQVSLNDEEIKALVMGAETLRRLAKRREFALGAMNRPLVSAVRKLKGSQPDCEDCHGAPARIKGRCRRCYDAHRYKEKKS